MLIMNDSGEVSGTPVHISKKILTDILRDDLNFTGVALSDWDDMKMLVELHHAVPNESGTDFCDHVYELVMVDSYLKP